MIRMARKSLSDILHNGQAESLRSAWDSTEAAGEFAPLPAGQYLARVESGELAASKAKGTPSYKLTFRDVPLVLMVAPLSDRRSKC
jgi:hypothetical protein